uniref:Putative flocculation protein FLO11-like n=1 Tax=Solanum chacoense TaxID=4108 RepID=A0A0V0HN50_SOLCH
MAPRGRPRKRLSRMDAATDAMTAFGFDERLVQKTVKQLLKEYGGDDGWAFIEEYGYKELIEAILRDQESNDEDSTKQKQGVSSQVERAEDPALLSTTCPSGTLNSTTNESGNTLGETGCSQLADAVEPTHEELCGNKQDIGSTEVLCLPPAEGCKDIEEDQTSYIQKRPANVFCNDGGNSGSRGSNFNVTVPPTSVNSVLAPTDHIPTTLPSSKRVCLQPPRRSFPCYGWIESDSEEDADDFILLPPMKCVGI